MVKLIAFPPLFLKVCVPFCSNSPHAPLNSGATMLPAFYMGCTEKEGSVHVIYQELSWALCMWIKLLTHFCECLQDSYLYFLVQFPEHHSSVFTYIGTTHDDGNQKNLGWGTPLKHLSLFSVAGRNIIFPVLELFAIFLFKNMQCLPLSAPSA